MHLVQLNKQVSVSGQMIVDDVAEVVANGVKLLVCNRPDDEDVGQIPYLEIQAEAERQGLNTRLLAFSSYQITNDNRDLLVELIATKQKIHLYCRSGSRSRRLWQTANKIGCGGHDFVDSSGLD
jgi:sulfide:quinone oxidoreductase